MSVIIVEGVDRCGKGTQIDFIKRRLEETGPVHVVHYSNIKGAADVYEASKKLYSQMFELCTFANLKNINLILDRAHIGETVYSPIYRNYDGDYVFDYEEQYLKYTTNQSTKLLLFTDEAKYLISREDGLSFSTDLKKKTDELERFDRGFELSKLQKKRIKITDSTAEEVFAQYESFLK
jgi:thymidylate kinase